MRHTRAFALIAALLAVGAVAIALFVLKIGPFGAVEKAPTQSPRTAHSSSTPQPQGTGESQEPSDPQDPAEPQEPPATRTPSEAEPLSWGPTAAQLAQAEAIVADMSDTELAGQVLISHWSGTDPKAAAKLVADYHLAGLIFMAPNIENAAQLKKVTAAVQNQQHAAGRDWPAIISVDQEGGRVARLRGVIDQVPAFAKLAAAGNDEVQSVLESMAAQMADLGFTMDFAPVADVSIGPKDPTIGDRAAGTDPEFVAAAAQAAMAGFLDGGVVPTIKHFPGHGSVTTDSHVEVPVQKRSLKELREKDFVPFAAAIDAGAPVVMMAHVSVEALDPGVPATLSSPAYELLRDELGFEGVIVTDAMNMQAITKTTGQGQEAVTALAAGADLVLMPADIKAAHGAIVTALQEGDLEREQIAASAARVVALQLWFDAELGE